MLQKEWDFSNLENDEIIHCRFWEYAREIDSWKEKVQQFREKFSQRSKELLQYFKKYNIPPGDGFDSYFYSFEDYDGGVPSTWLIDGLLERIKLPDDTFLYSPEWPDVPYLTIEKGERLRRNLLSNHGFLHPGFVNVETGNRNCFNDKYLSEIPINLFTEDYPKFIEKLNSKDPNRFRIVPFVIDFKKSKSTHIKQFAKWLDFNSPHDIKPIEKRGRGSGIKSLKAELKALGAYRLLKKMNWKDAADHTQNIIGKSLYGDQSEWIKARKKVKNIILKIGL